MLTHAYAGRTVTVDAEGYLTDSAQWTPEIADDIAREIGLGALTSEHWRVIGYCREDAAKTGQSPGLRRVAQYSGASMKDLYRLFPKGPGKLASRVAGLPKPKSCV